ncbi:hypothetical protein [Terrimonas pollutisoli]|uniref:hypothetical protein n=1 Tax=Terrimonas pollutisoli TaxID=3034147 RepID=UPI0023EB94D9|nr:hypothetical protein [Terrimonas sp. H1YJ31]
MKRSDYIQQRDELIHYYQNQFSFNDHERMQAQLNLVSASLSNYLPTIPYCQHERLYKEILLHKKLSILEQSADFLLQESPTENLSCTVQAVLQQPCIICTFHTGSYRLLNLFLAQQGIPFTLVIGKAVIEQDGQRFCELYHQLPGVQEDAFHLLDAEAPGAGLQMLRELKKGRSLVLYIDGNTGAGANTRDNANHCVVDLLTQQLYARKGIAYLAHAARVPIVAAASYRKALDKVALRFFDPIFPDKDDRAAFAEHTTQAIYDLAAPIIQQYPAQWEAWLYLHRMAKIKKPVWPPNEILPRKSDVVFNSALFGIFKMNNVPFLLRKHDYSFHEIDQRLYELLTAAPRSINKARLEASVFRQLYRHRVLVDEAMNSSA